LRSFPTRRSSDLCGWFFSGPRCAVLERTGSACFYNTRPLLTFILPQDYAQEDDSMNVKPIPDGYHTLTPYFAVRDAAGLIEFLQQAFDADVTERLAMPDGTVMHAQVKVGDSMVMIGQAGDEQYKL